MGCNLLQGPGRGQCSLFQPRVHLLDVVHAPYKGVHLLAEATQLLRDQLEVLHPREDNRTLLGADALGPCDDAVSLRAGADERHGHIELALRRLDVALRRPGQRVEALDVANRLAPAR
jgi:hypothetical protein